MKADLLTPNQAAIADAVATGRTIKEVAYFLRKSPQTVFNTLSKMYERLDIPHNLSALAVWRVCTLHGIEIPEFIRSAKALSLALLVMMQIAFEDGNTQRVRRSGRRGRYDFEIVEFIDNEEE